MKRTMVLCAILIVLTAQVTAQSEKPVRIEAFFATGYGIGLGYSFQVGNMSIEPSICGMLGTYETFSYGGSLYIRGYPFSTDGEGFYLETGYNLIYIPNPESTTPIYANTIEAFVGFRFMFLDFMTAHIGIGPQYQIKYQGNSFNDNGHILFGANFGLGIAF